MSDRSVPVLMYHHVAPTDREINVYPDVFEDQLRVLSRKGWKTLTGDEFLGFLKNPSEAPKKCVLITFDDGFADNYVYAYPLLRKYGMRAMIFVATGFIADDDVKREGFVPLSHDKAWKLAFTDRRSESMCTWKELKEMQQSGAIDIQSHGHSHLIPQYIAQKKYQDVMDDLNAGKKALQERLSKDVRHLAWPKGCYDEQAIEIAGGLGYEALYTVDRGSNTREDLKAVHRLPVKIRNGRWLARKASIYSSVLLSRFYLAVRKK